MVKVRISRLHILVEFRVLAKACASPAAQAAQAAPRTTSLATRRLCNCLMILKQFISFLLFYSHDQTLVSDFSSVVGKHSKRR